MQTALRGYISFGVTLRRSFISTCRLEMSMLFTHDTPFCSMTTLTKVFLYSQKLPAAARWISTYVFLAASPPKKALIQHARDLIVKVIPILAAHRIQLATRLGNVNKRYFGGLLDRGRAMSKGLGSLIREVRDGARRKQLTY